VKKHDNKTHHGPFYCWAYTTKVIMDNASELIEGVRSSEFTEEVFIFAF